MFESSRERERNKEIKKEIKKYKERSGYTRTKKKERNK